MGKVGKGQVGGGDRGGVGKILGAGSAGEQEGGPRQGWAKKKIDMDVKVGCANTPDRLAQGKNPFMGNLIGKIGTTSIESSPRKTNPFKHTFGIGHGPGLVHPKLNVRGFGMVTPQVPSQREVFDKKSPPPGPNPLAALFGGLLGHKQPAKKLTGNDSLLKLLAFGVIQNFKWAFDKYRLIRFSRSIISDFEAKKNDLKQNGPSKSYLELFKEAVGTWTSQA